MTKGWCRWSLGLHFQFSPCQGRLPFLSLYPVAWPKTLKVMLHTSSSMPSISSFNPNKSTNKTYQMHLLLSISSGIIPGQATNIFCPDYCNSLLHRSLHYRPSSFQPKLHYTASNPCGGEICPLHLEYKAKHYPAQPGCLSVYPCSPSFFFWATAIQLHWPLSFTNLATHFLSLSLSLGLLTCFPLPEIFCLLII